MLYAHVEHSPTKTIYIKYYTQKTNQKTALQTHTTHTHTHTHTTHHTHTHNDCSRNWVLTLGWKYSIAFTWTMTHKRIPCFVAVIKSLPHCHFHCWCCTCCLARNPFSLVNLGVSDFMEPVWLIERNAFIGPESVVRPCFGDMYIVKNCRFSTADSWGKYICKFCKVILK